MQVIADEIYGDMVFEGESFEYHLRGMSSAVGPKSGLAEIYLPF
eukprot:COSAG01_NODE_23633_length_807_cov_41.605932_1_plen_44_part_00